MTDTRETKIKELEDKAKVLSNEARVYRNELAAEEMQRHKAYFETIKNKIYFRAIPESTYADKETISYEIMIPRSCNNDNYHKYGSCNIDLFKIHVRKRPNKDDLVEYITAIKDNQRIDSLTKLATDVDLAKIKGYLHQTIIQFSSLIKDTQDEPDSTQA